MIARIAALFVLLLGAPFGAQAQITSLAPPDTVDALAFGEAIAMDGNRAIVGAPEEKVCGPDSGAAYVYERDPEWGTWEAVARITPDPCRENAFFGNAVALHGDRALISASAEFFATPEPDAAFVFERRGTDWEQTAALTGENDVQEGAFAADVALTERHAVVSTRGDYQGTFGGAVYVFTYDAETEGWNREARLTSERPVERGILGGTLSAYGNRIAVSAPMYFADALGEVHIFEREESTGDWITATVLPDMDDFSVPVSLHGSHMLVGERRAGSNRSGHATLYKQTDGGAWNKLQTLTPRVPYEDGAFGSAVAVHDDWALITGYDEQLQQDVNIDRVVYVFRRAENDTWQQHTIIDVGRLDFGTDLALDQGIALVSWVPPQGEGKVYAITLQ